MSPVRIFTPCKEVTWWLLFGRVIFCQVSSQASRVLNSPPSCHELQWVTALVTHWYQLNIRLLEVWLLQLWPKYPVTTWKKHLQSIAHLHRWQILYVPVLLWKRSFCSLMSLFHQHILNIVIFVLVLQYSSFCLPSHFSCSLTCIGRMDGGQKDIQNQGARREIPGEIWQHSFFRLGPVNSQVGYQRIQSEQL